MINMEEAIKDDLIQDVSAVAEPLEAIELEPVEVEALERKLSPREQKMQDVVDQHKAQLKDNYGEPVVDRVIPQDEEEDHGEVKPRETVKSPVYQNDAGEFVIKLKIDGREVERPFDQVLATAQKHEAADKRLQDINARQQQLDQYEQLLRNKEASITAQPVAQPSKQDAGIEDSDEAMDAFFEQIYDGNTKGAKEVLKEILKGRQQPTLNTDELRQQLTESAVVEIENRNRQREYQGSLSTGVEWLKSNHPDIVSDPLLYRTIDTQTNIVERENPSFTPEQVIKRATEQVLERLGSTKTSSNRADNKAKLISQPARQANSRYVPPAKQELDNSPLAIIARQKASRSALARRSV